MNAKLHSISQSTTMKDLCVLFLFLLCCGTSTASLGVDLSADLCGSMSDSDWSCLVKEGYTFAIVQAWSGGYGLNPHLGM